MKERVRAKCYLRYCDDATGRAKTKAQTRRELQAFEALSEQRGLVVKHTAIVAPIGTGERNERKKNRKRKRSKRTKHRLSRVLLQFQSGETEEKY